MKEALKGTSLRAEDKLDALRKIIYNKKYTNSEDIYQFVNRYITEHPDDVHNKSPSIANQIISNIRSELGLSASGHPSVTKTISLHVKDLIAGRAQASEDSARWAVHHAANQVTMYSGQFVYGAEDINLDGAGIDFVFHRTHKNQGYYNGPLGINWDHNYNLRLRKEDDNKIVALTGGFQETTYVKHGHYSNAGCNYWVPPTGEHSIVIDVSDVARRQEYDVQLSSYCQNCEYAVRTADGDLFVYQQETGTTDHYVIKLIQDRTGNYLRFAYEQGNNQTIQRIKLIYINSQYRNVRFSYDTNDRITHIKDHMGRVWKYQYDDFSDLVSFTTPDTQRYKSGLTERYDYSTAYYTGELQHNMTDVYDTAGRHFLENEYGDEKGLLTFNRVTRQREGKGLRMFDYEDVRLATGIPAGQKQIEEDMPAYQTIMARRNGHPVHYVYNKFGNLIVREEDCWESGARRRLISRYRYNRDGTLIGELSSEGRITQYLYGRDDYLERYHAIDQSEQQLRKRTDMIWQRRLGFGNRLAVVQRADKKKPLSHISFTNPFAGIGIASTEDIISKFTFESKYQNITSVSDPRQTKSALPGAAVDNNQTYNATLTSFHYDASSKYLLKIQYPNTTRNNAVDISNITEHFDCDKRGRLIDYIDQSGTHTNLEYFNNGDAKDGYLRRQIVDQINPSNPDGLNINTEYEVNDAGIVTSMVTPKKKVMKFNVDKHNRVTKVIRRLSTNVAYETRYEYCRNMRVERIERDIQDEAGNPLSGGTEVQFFHFDENDNVSRQQVGGPYFSNHLITHHTYDDGELRVGTTLPRGNRIRISYDERRLPKQIERGVGSSEAVRVKVVYDGDGLLREQRDGRGLKTELDYDSFGRVVKTRDYDEQDNLCRLIRQDYDKAGNLTIERLFKPDGNAYRLLYHASYRYDELNQRIETRLRRFQTPIAYSAAEMDKDDDYVPPDPDHAVRTLYFYDKAGRPTNVEQHGRRLDANGQPQLQDTTLASKYEYNSVGWLIAETDQLGNRTEMRYDKHGLMTRVDVREKVPLADSPTGEEIFTTIYKYDGLDRLKSIKDGLGNVTCFEYDSRDSIIRQENPLGNITSFDYDIYGRQVTERIEMTDTGLGGGPRQSNSDIVTQYVYDSNSNLIRLVDAHNTPTLQVYDALDRRIEMRFVDGSATKYKYDGNENVVWLQDNNGLIKRTTYDPLDHPVRMDVDKNGLKPNVIVEGAMYEAFEYDALGQMTRAKNGWTDIRCKVDSLGRTYEESVKFSDQASVFILKRAYDDFDFLSRLTYPNGRVLVYQSEKLNRIKKIENKTYGADYPGDNTLPQQRMILENTYQGLRIGRKAYGNGASTEYAYDGAGRIISISHRDAQNAELLTIQHLYDAAGNMRVKREFAPNDNYGEVYKYDSRSQLTFFQEINPSPTNADRLNVKALAPTTSILAENQLKGQIQVIDSMLGSLAQVHNQFTFKYNKLSNRLEERAPNQPQPITYTPNNLNQYTQRNNTQYNYDPSGNLRREKTGMTTRDYIYNHRNQIVRVSEGGDLAQFRYDALGRRLWSDMGGVKSYFLYDDENVIEEWRPAVQSPTASLMHYVNEFEIDSHCQLTVDGVDYWYHKDLIGSTRLLSNMIGGQAMSDGGQPQPVGYRYTPFGRLMKPLPNLPNFYLFAGRRYYPIEGVYDFRSRSYCPSLGHFLQRDLKDLDETPNLYWYCRNNGLTLIDPYGEREKTAGDWAFLESVREMQLAGRQVLRGKGIKVKAIAALKTAGWLGAATVGALPWLIERPAVLVSDVMAGVENTVGRQTLLGLEISLSQSGPGPGRPVAGGIYAARWYARFSRFSQLARRSKSTGIRTGAKRSIDIGQMAPGSSSSISSGSSVSADKLLVDQFLHQQPQQVCGLACNIMVADTYGLNIGFRKMRELTGRLAGRPYMDELASALQKLGISAKVQSMSYRELARATSKGEPLIALQRLGPGAKDIHVVVVDKVLKMKGSGQFVFYRDPAGGRLVVRSMKEFRKAFHSQVITTKGG